MKDSIIADEIFKAFGKAIIIALVGVIFPMTTGIELLLGWIAWVYFPCYNRYTMRRRKEKEIKKCVEEILEETNKK